MTVRSLRTCDRCGTTIKGQFWRILSTEGASPTGVLFDLCKNCKLDFNKFMSETPQ